MLANKYTILVLIIVTTFSLGGCQNADEANQPDTSQYPNAELLVSADWLNAHLDDSNLLIIDARDEEDYTTSHIPNAVHVSINDLASTIDNIDIEFDQAEVQQTVNGIGLTPEKTIIIYDNLGMMTSGRLFWTFEYIGHPDVRVLHGGWNAWNEVGYETNTEIPEVTPSEYPITLDESRLATSEYIQEHLDDPGVVLLDARAPKEYTGEVVYAERGGHIPGALNLPWVDTLTGGDVVYTTEDDWREQLEDDDVEVFQSAEEIQTMLDELGVSPEQEVITYCQTFWRASQLYFVLRLMGYQNIRGYDGSWDEWGNQPTLPVVTGDTPL